MLFRSYSLAIIKWENTYKLGIRLNIAYSEWDDYRKQNGQDECIGNPQSRGIPTWFAVRVSYSRELALKAILDEENIESFIPMRYGIVMKGGKRVRKLVPAIHNLVFIHSTRKRIDALKDELEGKMPIRFIMNRDRKSVV